MMIFQFIFFLFLIYIFIYAPGRFLLRKAGCHQDLVSISTLSIGLGVATLLLLAYGFAWIKLDYIALLFMSLLALLDRGRAGKEFIASIKKLDRYKMEMSLVIVGIIGMVYLTARSGVIENRQYIFYGINAVDSLYHLSLIGNLTHSFPPEHFGLSGIPLRGYHFFYDFLLAIFAKNFHFTINDLYFRLFPVFITLFFALSFISLSQQKSWKKSTRIPLLFFIFFLGNFEFIFNFFAHTEFLAHIPEGVTQILDPSVPLSLAIFLCGYIFLTTKKRTTALLPLAAIVIGVLPMIKIYTAILFFVGFGMMLVWKIVKKHYPKYDLLVFFLSGLIAATVYLPINYGAGGFVLAPFIFIRHLMEGSATFQSLHWPVRYQIFESHQNFPQMGLIVVTITGLFLVETLGFRLLVGMWYLWIKKRTIQLSEDLIFWSSIFATGMLIPLIFIQSSSVFNIVQFYWIVLALSIPFFTFQLDSIVQTFNLGVRRIVWIVIISSCIPSLLGLYQEYSISPTRIPRATSTLASRIPTLVPPSYSLLVLGKEEYSSVPLMAALSSRTIYLESEGIDFASLQNEIYDRKKKLDRILTLAHDCSTSEQKQEMKTLLNSTQTNYIYAFNHYSCFQDKKVFKVMSSSMDQQLIEIL